MTIQELATTALEHFDTVTRDKGETIWVKTDDAPEWLADLIQSAHGDMFPDDFKYEFVHDALSAIADSDSRDEDSPEIEADVYTSDLLKWLSSHLERPGYVDDAVSEWGWENLFSAMQAGQIKEKEEVYFSVLGSLREHLEEIEDEEEEGSEED